jgi:hypothetical protein
MIEGEHTMSPRELKKCIKPKSFRPFTIAAKDGRRFRIDHELDLDIDEHQEPARVAILGPAGMIYVLAAEEIRE